MHKYPIDLYKTQDGFRMHMGELECPWATSSLLTWLGIAAIVTGATWKSNQPIHPEDEQKIKITLDRKYEKNNDYFQLETIYQNHKDIVIELILKEINYPKSYIDELIKNGFGTEEEIYRFIFSNYLENDKLHQRPLSKLTRDIVEELGILEKIKLLIKEK